jgi:adenosylcobyric acid synthase
MARALHIQGTSSHAGKSVLTAAFGCWLQSLGFKVAPFKAQNMSLNSFVTLRGEEIARSQAAQAEALGLEPSADMNPILLKPLEHGCQVIVQGHGIGVMSIREYYAYKPQAWQAITASYDRLMSAHDVIVLEGAGSPAEINLKAHDLVNMRMAEHADAVVLLVADIERGGVFAQLIGTWELLEPPERERVAGFIINKFRGDVSLLESGLAYVRQRTGRPVLGVLPHDPAVQLDEEDSLGVQECTTTAEIDVVVLRLPGLSNFTDFAALARAPGVAVRYVSAAAQLRQPDLVILPGTRTTVRALQWMRSVGLTEAVSRLAGAPEGPYVLGLCGGLQILGQTIHDPENIESSCPRADGLGLLDLDTSFDARKVLGRVQGEVAAAGALGYGCPVVGYEIHQGTSVRRDGCRPWLRVSRQPSGVVLEDGAVSRDGRVLGTYVHGLFDDARFCRELVVSLRRRRGLSPLREEAWKAERSLAAGRNGWLGRWVVDHCDLGPVLAALEKRFPNKPAGE